MKFKKLLTSGEWTEYWCAGCGDTVTANQAYMLVGFSKAKNHPAGIFYHPKCADELQRANSSK